MASFYESRAISRYLIAKYGKDSSLLPPPSDLKASGLFEQAASIEYSIFDPPASSLAYELVFAKSVGMWFSKHAFLIQSA
jgi:glutathione S-transferase